MRLKFLSILLVIALISSIVFLSGCGAKKEEAATEEQVTASDNQNTENSGDTKNENTSSKEQAKAKKKVVYVLEDDNEFRVAEKNNFVSTLEKSGYVKDQNLEYTEINLKGDEKNCEAAINKIKEVKPDVAILGSGGFIDRAMVKPLSETDISVIVTCEVGNKDLDIVDSDGKPKKNITGIYTVPRDVGVNSYKLLQKIYPTNGKKAVFLTVAGFYKKEDIEKDLKAAGVELKDFCEVNNFEEWQEVVKKYKDDKEVAWMLPGIITPTHKDGSKVDIMATFKWDLINRKTPEVTYWESAVQIGYMCALGSDIAANGIQATEMALKIFNGEKISDIKAEDPRKVSIVFNSKRAKDLGITIPPEILASAAKVYTTTAADQK